MKVLVTGADGFIGSHLTETLVRNGFSTKAFVLYNSFGSRGWLDRSSKDILSNLEVFSGDIRDPHGVRTAMKGCDMVFHLAALIAIPYSYHSPDSYVQTNVTGTLNLLQAARDIGISRFIHTSTSEVYGSARFVPITEEHPLQGQSPYSATKIAADQLAFSFYSSFALPVVTVRPFNTYGPRQSTRAVLPTIITQLAKGERKICLGSLHPTRDFNYINDTVSGFLSAAQSEIAIGETINIGSNYEISIGESVSMIADLMGVNVEIESDQDRLRPKPSEVERLWADNTKARELCGWRPAYGGKEGLRRGLAKTIEWFTIPENLAQYRTDIYQI